MTRLYLARHGESTANTIRIFTNQVDQYPLTDLGRQQAQELNEKLSQALLQSIFSSPLLRALETAQIVAKHHGLDVQVDQDLIEFDVGSYEGHTDDNHWNTFLAQLWRWREGKEIDANVGGGESPRVMIVRVQRFLDRIASIGGTHLAITHGGLICCTLPHMIPNMGPGFMTHHEIRNTGHIILDHTPDGWTLTEWNADDPKD